MCARPALSRILRRRRQEAQRAMYAASHSCHALCVVDGKNVARAMRATSNSHRAIGIVADDQVSVLCAPRPSPATRLASPTTQSPAREVRRVPLLPRIFCTVDDETSACDVRRVPFLPRIAHRRWQRAQRATCAASGSCHAFPTADDIK